MFTNGNTAEAILNKQPALERKSLFDENGFHGQITGGWGKYGYEIPSGKRLIGGKVDFNNNPNVCDFEKYNSNWDDAVFVFGTQKLIDFSGYRYLVLKVRGTAEVSDLDVVLTDDKDLTSQDPSAKRYNIITTGSDQIFVIDLAKDGLSGESRFIALTAGLAGWDITTQENFTCKEVYLTNTDPNKKTLWLYKKGVEGAESGGWGDDNWTITTPGHLGTKQSNHLELTGQNNGNWSDRRAYMCAQALIPNEYSQLGISFKFTKNSETDLDADVMIYATRNDYQGSDFIVGAILTNKYRTALDDYVTEVIPIPHDMDNIAIKIVFSAGAETGDTMCVNGVWLEV